jgi:hypothetical protein
MLNVMVEEEKNYTVTRMEFLERGRVEYLEQENKHHCVQDEKIQLAKIKEEREKNQKGERKNERGEGKNQRGEGNYNNEFSYIVSSATRIFSSTPIGNPCKEKDR